MSNVGVKRNIMAQFRLTKKYADDLKVSKLALPTPVTPIYDDWVIDVIRVQRKKVAMMTHVKSLLTFLLPYEEVGGAKSVPDCIGVLLDAFVRENDLEIAENQIEKIFSTPPTFCKTDNRKVLGHMNDFKSCVQAFVAHYGGNFVDIDWDDVMHSVNNTLVGVQGYGRPIEIAKELFAGKAVN